MLIYNITYLVADRETETWLQWMKEKVIPEMLAADIFANPQIAKVLTNLDEGGSSYSVQFHCDSAYELDKWQQTNVENLQEECSRMFGAEVLFFPTILKLID